MVSLQVTSPLRHHQDLCPRPAVFANQTGLWRTKHPLANNRQKFMDKWFAKIHATGKSFGALSRVFVLSRQLDSKGLTDRHNSARDGPSLASVTPS
tara:strand:- start:2176 stop:2463 length:288 start_codon:yes stop_codon:yes gene_type:complete